MALTFAYECYADGDVFLFLRDHCKLPIKKLHSYSQGEVINDLLVRNRAEVGMVDEDPLSSHHKLRDQMQVVEGNDDLELRIKQDQHLIIVKPELEECFVKSMKRVRLDSKLPAQAKELQRILSVPNRSQHEVFREELTMLYRESKAQNVQTFVTRIEAVLRRLLGG